MIVTQHAHIYSFHSSKFNFGEIFFLIFLSYSPYLRSNSKIFWMTIHNGITIQAPWKSREFDRVLHNILHVPYFLSLGQVELVATASWYFYQAWAIPKWTNGPIDVIDLCQHSSRWLDSWRREGWHLVYLNIDGGLLLILRYLSTHSLLFEWIF